MSRPLSCRAFEIPLLLIPKVIARLIRLKGEAVYRISVVRTHWHHYNVSVRTKRIKRELVPKKAANLEALIRTGKEDHASEKGRGCAA